MPPQICMGMCLHQDITEEGKKAKLQSSKIEQDLCEHARTEMNVVKILMLGELKPQQCKRLFFVRFRWSVDILKRFSLASGAAESGKSTLIKQIKIIHSHGFSKQELISFKVLDSCKANGASLTKAVAGSVSVK